MKRNIFFGLVSVMAVINGAVAFGDQGESQAQLRGEGLILKCKSAGAEMTWLGQSQVDSDADVKFNLKERQDGLRVIEKLKGEIVLDHSRSVSETLVAHFSEEKVVENADYHPRVYKGFSQFKNINAVESEDSQNLNMVGTLLVEKDLEREHIRAVYQFQAGDSMGGVLKMTCLKQKGD